MRASDDYRAAVALVGARLRGDSEGEQVIAADCCPDCRPLVDGLVTFAENALKAVAHIDKAPPAVAADAIDAYLRQISGAGRA
jgi:hypothetical protein